MALYARRLTAQTEALYSLLQTSFSEIRAQQDKLASLVVSASDSVLGLEKRVGEVTEKVGREVDQTLVQLRRILSTTNSVLMALEGKVVEMEAAAAMVGGRSGGVVGKRMERIERGLEGVIEAVERLERGFTSFGHGKNPCACGGDTVKGDTTVIAGTGEPKVKVKLAPKRRRLLSDSEILELELEDINRTRVRCEEKAEREDSGSVQTYSDDENNGGKTSDEHTDTDTHAGSQLAQNVVEPVKLAQARGVKRRILLTTQELESMLVSRK